MPLGVEGLNMADKLSDENLRRLREYIAEEARRLGDCGGKVIHIDLNAVDDDRTCSIPGAPSDPLERDLDVLFGCREKNKHPET